MSGNIESTVDDLWQQFEEASQQYIATLGLNKIKYNKEVDEYLTLTREQLYSMPSTTLGEAAFLLAQYAACLQKEFNEHQVKLNWAQHNMNVRYGKVCKNYGNQYTKFEERKVMALGEDRALQLLNKMSLYASSHIKNLDMMANRVSVMQKTLSDLQYTKRRQDG